MFRLRPSSLRPWFAQGGAAWLRAATLGGLVTVLLLAKWMLFVSDRYESQLVLRPALATNSQSALSALQELAHEPMAGEQDADQLERNVVELDGGRALLTCRAASALRAYEVCVALSRRATARGLAPAAAEGTLRPRPLPLANPWGVWLTCCAVGAAATLLVAVRPWGSKRERPLSHTAGERAPRESANADARVSRTPSAPSSSAPPPHPDVSEQLKSLRDQIYLLAADKCLIVGISSAPAQRSRKGILATQLAAVLSESQQVNVLLIEADFEQPSLDRLLDITMSPRAGFSQQVRQRFVSGSEGSWIVVRRSNTLSVLAEGLVRIPSLLSSPEFSSAMAQLRQQYDIIVMNGPVIGRGADARAFFAFVDVVVFALQPGRDPGEAVRLAAKRLKTKRVAVVAVGNEEEIGQT